MIYMTVFYSVFNAAASVIVTCYSLMEHENKIKVLERQIAYFPYCI
jgi:tRNA C32,U32 (ribose-2'-O)-methylase TrmJ